MTSETKHKTLFLSDLHLGSHKCKADKLYDFLKRNTADFIYLVGDVFEGTFDNEWPQKHKEILRELFNKAWSGSKIVYVPGNHDYQFRKHCGRYGNLYIVRQVMHTTVNGKEILVSHGDETDVIRFHSVLRVITWFENKTHWHLWEIARRTFTKWIDQHSLKFAEKMIKEARGYDGVACGHIHKPHILQNEDFIYLNSGDWTYHCSAIAEDFHGRFSLLYS